MVSSLATQAPGLKLTAPPGHNRPADVCLPRFLIKIQAMQRQPVCASMHANVCVCAFSKFTKSTIYQEKMFPCFLHELYKAGVCCAFCYFCQAVLWSLFPFSTFVGIII